MVPETRAELPQAQSPGPAAQQDTSRASHSHPWGQGCPSHRQLPVLSEPCTASAQPQRQPSAVGEDPGAARIIPRSSSAALRQLPGQGSRRGASRHARLWSSSPCVRPQGPGFCPAARSRPRRPPAPLPTLPGGTSLTPLPCGMLGEGLPQCSEQGRARIYVAALQHSRTVTRQHQRRARYRYADIGAREPNATASRLMRSSLQCSPREKGHTRTGRAPNPLLLPAGVKRGEEKCPDPPPAPKTTGAPRAPPLHQGSSPLHQLIPTSFKPAHRKMIHIPRQALRSKEYQICSCPHNVTSGLRACVLHSE